MKPCAKNQKTVKKENLALIFRYMRLGPISRAEISKQAGMSKSAVTMITNPLISEGQLAEVGATDSSYGRKPILLDIVADYKYAAGIALHRECCSVCITDLKAGIVASEQIRTDCWKDPYVLLDHAYAKIQDFLREHHIPPEKCIGIGVSAPGPLDYRTGQILNPPDFALFHRVEVGKYLREKSGLPVTVDNNAVLLAMQEYASFPESRYRNLMFISFIGGIGAAVLTDGKIFRGYGGFAGELGHTAIHPDGIPCSCGNRGCLERYASMNALKERFGFSSYEDLVDRAYEGDMASVQILEYLAKELSYAVVNAINLFDLDAVILYGAFSYRPQKLLKMLHDRVNRCAVIVRTHEVAIRFSAMSDEQANASVCAAILNAYFDQNL